MSESKKKRVTFDLPPLGTPTEPAAAIEEVEPMQVANNPPTREEIVEACARAAHEANRVYCAQIGDPGQVAWEDAPEWQRVSCYMGVEAILRDNASPEASHNGWMAHKRAEGWKYGPTKDEVRREHPCFVPYSELPVTQRVKDAIFGAVVRGVAVHHGLKVAPAAFML